MNTTLCDNVLLLDVLVQGVENGRQRIATKEETPVILNPAPAQKVDSEVLSKVAVLTPNEIEEA